MKTIIVVYTDRKLSMTEANARKSYAFRTEEDLKVGDMVKSKSYGDAMQVIRVLDEGYQFYNKMTGELSNTYVSTMQYSTKVLKLETEEDEDTVYFKKIEKEA